MDFAILVSTSLIENDNAPPAVILTDENTSIGRHANIKMDTSRTHEVSKYHAYIRYQGAHGKSMWMIEDNKSMNGTFLNSKKIKRHLIKDGDEIVFGGGSCFFYGDQVTSTEAAECRYLFVIPEPKVIFAETSNKDIILSQIDECEDCCICYLPMAMKTQLSCGHSFCRRCLSQWGKQCERKEIPFVCPICRHEFDSSQAKIPSVILKDEYYHIFDVEPFLRILEVCSLSEVEKLSIFNIWNNDDKENFWNFLNKIRHSQKKMIIFRTVTNSSFRDIKNADLDKLENAKKNFSIEIASKYLRDGIMKHVAIEIYHKEYVKPQPKAPSHHVRKY